MKKLDSVQKRISFIYKLIALVSCLSFLVFLIVGSLVLANYFINNKTDLLNDAVFPLLYCFLIIFPIDGLIIFLILTLSSMYRLRVKKNISMQDIGSFYDFARSDVICIDEGDILFNNKCSVKEVVALDKEKENQIIDIVGSIASRVLNDDPLIYALQHLSFIPLFIDGKVEESDDKYVAYYNGYKYVVGKLSSFKYRAEEYVKTKAEPYLSKGYEVYAIGKYEFDKKYEKYVDFASVFGLIVVENDINKDFKQAINYFQDNSKKVIFLSSGNAVKASEQAKLIGIKNADKYSSRNIDEGYTVYGDLNKEDKMRLVASLQEKGMVVTTITNSGIRNSNCSISFNNTSGAEVVFSSKDVSIIDAYEEAIASYNNLRRLFVMSIFKTVFVSIYFLIISILSLLGFDSDWRSIILGAISSLCVMVMLISSYDKKIDNKKLLPRIVVSSILSVLSIGMFFVLFALQYNEIAYTGINDLNTCLTMSGVTFMIVVPMVFVSLIYDRLDMRRGVFTSLLFVLIFASLGVICGLSLYFNKEVFGFYFHLWNGQNILTTVMVIFLFISIYFISNYLVDNYKGGNKDEN